MGLRASGTGFLLLLGLGSSVCSAFVSFGGQEGLCRGRRSPGIRRSFGRGSADVRSEGGGGGGSRITISERPWNSSTMGSLPGSIYDLAKDMADCAKTAVVNGELGLVVSVGGEYCPDNKFYDHTVLTELVVEFAAKMCTIGQTRVLFAGTEELEATMKDMAKLKALEAKRDQEESAVIARVRRKVQAQYPGVAVPEVPSEFAKEKENRRRELERLGNNVKWGDLLGGYMLSGDPMTDMEDAPVAAVRQLDLDHDRLVIIVSPGKSMVEMVATRRILRAARDRPVILVNHRLSPEPMELAVFQQAYFLDIWNFKRPARVQLPSAAMDSDPYYDFPMPSLHGDGAIAFAKRREEVDTVLLRKFPNFYQVFCDLGEQTEEGKAKFELVQTFFDKPEPEAVRARVWEVVEERERAMVGRR